MAAVRKPTLAPKYSSNNNKELGKLHRRRWSRLQSETETEQLSPMAIKMGFGVAISGDFSVAPSLTTTATFGMFRVSFFSPLHRIVLNMYFTVISSKTYYRPPPLPQGNSSWSHSVGYSCSAWLQFENLQIKLKLIFATAIIVTGKCSSVTSRGVSITLAISFHLLLRRIPPFRLLLGC